MSVILLNCSTFFFFYISLFFVLFLHLLLHLIPPHIFFVLFLFPSAFVSWNIQFVSDKMKKNRWSDEIEKLQPNMSYYRNGKENFEVYVFNMKSVATLMAYVLSWYHIRE